jgi:hygromycin-B 7''-O-kinase
LEPGAVNLLPREIDPATYQRVWADDAFFAAAVQAILRRHAIAAAPVRYSSGTAVAYRLSDAVLKLYPPFAAADADLEIDVLTRLLTLPRLPGPRHLADGALDGFRYLLMSHLPGEPIERSWAELSATARVQLAREAGTLVHLLHTARSSDLPRANGEWDEFRAAMRARALDHHVRSGLPAERARELRSLLEMLDAEPELDSARVLLHTELGPGHLLVEHGQITGLIDFAEAREGPPEYDMAAVGLFITRGDAAAFAAFLDAYGVPESRRGKPLLRRLMRHTLLHEYGHLTFYLRHAPAPPHAPLEALAEHWFAH